MDDGNCEDALEELYSFLDDELDDLRRAHIKRHLDDCTPCLEVYDFHAELRVMISNKCRDKVPTELRDRIARILGEQAI